MLISFYSFSDFSLEYKTSKDVFRLSMDEIEDCLNKYLNKKVSFPVSNYYGCSENVSFWINCFKCINHGNYKEYRVGIVSNSDVPERFYPSLLQIGKKLGLFAPISYGIIKR